MTYRRGMFMSVALASLIALSGCTHLEVNKYESGGQLPDGYAYMLDFTQYQVVLTRTLSDCTEGELPGITAEAKVTPLLAPDGDQLYVIDPASMISAFKTSDINIEYKDGRLVSFNASTVDKTGEVLASVITTVGKIAMLAAVPIPVAGQTQFCTPEAVAKLKLINESKKPINEATANVEDAESRLATLTAQYAAEPTEVLRVKVKKLTGDLKTAKDALDKQTKAVAAAQAWSTDSVNITWPETSADFHRGPGNTLGPAVVAKWFDVNAIRGLIATRSEYSPRLDANTRLMVAGTDGTAERLGVSPAEFARAYPNLREGADFLACAKDAACAVSKTALEKALVDRQVNRVTRAPVSFRIVRRGSYGTEAKSASSAAAKAGLRYRVPAAGTFYICTFDEPCHLGANTPLSRTDGAVAQLGTVFNLPFSSPAFASGGITVKFDDQGRLLQAGLKRDSSVALGAATTVGAAVDQLSSVLAAAEKAPITEAANATKLAQARKALADAEATLTKTPQQAATEELALLKTQQDIATARAALGPDRARDLTQQIAVTKLEVDLADIQRKQAADPNAGQAAVAAQYDAETTVLNARRASAQAELALLQAEQALALAKKPTS